MKEETPISEITDTFLDWYIENRHKPDLAELNDYLLNAALSARGYNNVESGETFFIREILAPSAPKLCLDIGANVGRYSLDLLQSTSTQVIAFEPLASSHRELVQNTFAYRERVFCENKGIGNVNGELTLHFDASASVLASFSEEVKKVSYVGNEEQATAEVVTLDSYCSANRITDIDLIKIDTEGFETEVFEGGRQVFSEIRPKFVQMEFNWHQMFRSKTLNDFAEKLPDYDVYQLLPDGWAQRDPRDPLSNLYQFSNFVFVLGN
ncbi:FkbM family methyltransferase [Roseibium aggregatum]|uniref:FkbM family methyltransferase n=1 Tax=Roseibium aggregatum TaxID=187304 RepID=A0A939J4V7_9HYPH|nr:FkbM family methyltransferase [Roseibium aggregatum]MBN9673978.1 FkbM family methyltransferase [Roseibium aggregatum]